MKFSFVLIILVCFVTGVTAQENNYKELWSAPLDESPLFQITAGDGKIFVPLPNGELRTLESETGKVLWTADLGGEFCDSLKLDQKHKTILALTKKEIGGKQFAALRAIRSDTGITQWLRSDEVLKNSDVTVLINDSKNLVISNEDVTASDNETGLVSRRFRVESKPNSSKSFDGHFLYYVSRANELSKLNIDDGRNETIYSSANSLQGKIILSGNVAYFSDYLGFVYCFDLIRAKLIWKTRLGADVIDLNANENPNQLLVTSKDIYFYQINKANGRKTKKVRLNSGTFGEMSTLRNSESAVVLSFDDEVIVINSKSGNITNRIPLKTQSTAAAVGISGSIIVVTAAGIIAYK